MLEYPWVECSLNCRLRKEEQIILNLPEIFFSFFFLVLGWLLILTIEKCRSLLLNGGDGTGVRMSVLARK